VVSHSVPFWPSLTFTLLTLSYEVAKTLLAPHHLCHGFATRARSCCWVHADVYLTPTFLQSQHIDTIVTHLNWVDLLSIYHIKLILLTISHFHPSHFELWSCKNFVGATPLVPWLCHPSPFVLLSACGSVSHSNFLTLTTYRHNSYTFKLSRFFYQFLISN
jgi:hypothetical protein